MSYPKCYIAEGCGGDEACVALCPKQPRLSTRADPRTATPCTEGLKSGTAADIEEEA